jgi:hypothetical protein
LSKKFNIHTSEKYIFGKLEYSLDLFLKNGYILETNNVFSKISKYLSIYLSLIPKYSEIASFFTKFHICVFKYTKNFLKSNNSFLSRKKLISLSIYLFIIFSNSDIFSSFVLDFITAGYHQKVKNSS